MGIDSMRVGGGRCPPLLVGGLLLACLFLVCNWWTLSSENLELLRQIDDLAEQLKISAEERDQCVTLRGSLEQRYKRTEEEVANLNVRLEQQNDLQKRKDELEGSVTLCNSELDSLKKLDATRTATLETLRLEKDTINSQLEDRREENRKLTEDLERVQEELTKLKLTLNSPENKKSALIMNKATPRGIISESQLGPVAESAVKVSPSGQRGLKFHGIPILPQDPPDAVRLTPHLSVTMLKATSDTRLDNGTLNGGNQETQNKHDQNEGIEDMNNLEDVDSTEDQFPAQESDRDQQMKVPAFADKKMSNNV